MLTRFDRDRSFVVARGVTAGEMHVQSSLRDSTYLHDAAELGDLAMPPGNRLERLKGGWRGFHSIRINDQWRVVFRWRDGNAYEVQVIAYH